MGFLSKITVNCSQEVQVCGAIGQVTSLNQKNTFVSDNEIGVGKTNSWYMGGLDRNKSIAFYFDVVNTANLPLHHKVHVQFITVYQHVNGATRMRVTTVQRLMSNPDDITELAYGFDQETAAVLLSRYSIYKTFSEDAMDVIRWLDRMLIKLVARFAEYKKDDPNSFKLSREFTLFP
jgi:protein transport protein SEC23